VRATRHASFALAEEGGWSVALDLELDDELRREGVARELVRSLNELRKDQGLAIADRVRVQLAGNDALQAAFDAHHDWIAEEVLAVELTWGDGGTLTVDIDGQTVPVSLSVV
jgi:isoleucyl-tRNA synthetase